MIARSHKTRIYLSKEQEATLLKWSDALRGIWNFTVREGYWEWLQANVDHAEEAQRDADEARWADDGGSYHYPAKRIFLAERVRAKDPKSLFQRSATGPAWMQAPPSKFRSQESRHMDLAWAQFKRTGCKPALRQKTGRVSMSSQGIRFVGPDLVVLPASSAMTKEEQEAFTQPIRLAEPIRDRLEAGRPGRGERVGPNGKKSPPRAPGWKAKDGDVGTISHYAGVWHISFPTAEHHPPAPRAEQLASRGLERVDVIGVDVNCSAYVCFDGTKHFRYEIPEKVFRLECQIEEAQRRLELTENGSNRNKKALLHLQKLRSTKASVMEDFLHKTAYDLVASARVVVVEDVHWQNLTKSAKGTVANPGKNVAAKSGLSRAILRASFGKFRTILTTKGEWFGTEVCQVDAAYTSQECSRCGARKKIALNKRTYRCDECGLVIDRDDNAATNIRNKFLRLRAQEAPGGSGEEDGTETLQLVGLTETELDQGRRRASDNDGDTHAGKPGSGAEHDSLASTPPPTVTPIQRELFDVSLKTSIGMSERCQSMTKQARWRELEAP